MPDKKRYVQEMARVLKPGGKMVIATWCQRDNQHAVLHEGKEVARTSSRKTRPYFISIKDCTTDLCMATA